MCKVYWREREAEDRLIEKTPLSERRWVVTNRHGVRRQSWNVPAESRRAALQRVSEISGLAPAALTIRFAPGLIY